MFAKPRPKKSLLPPPIKKRKIEHSIEEISFKDDDREEFLTGFRKRKQQRIKRAQEEAAKREKEDRRELRKKMREERQREVEEHVQKVNTLLRESEAAGAIGHDESGSDGSEWGGIEEAATNDIIDHEEEYIDEDRYTTVTVESVSVTRDGLHKPALEPTEDEQEAEKAKKSAEEEQAKAKLRPPKKPKKKFRYESKTERQLTEAKIRAKRKAKRD
ncbi:unnamed protein product [Parascedosporium putredinis]|uniref:Nucleolar protein 12 n=1 Tax=Parascedosporium putredinis TaxID=1442378 RepID=A0A9P1GUA0_9PEZI|nr:unnamed protein product [Parascedosporium putredinis]CAI7987512.1 unnamed protein product [Parascedosporium putredinis]